MVESSELLERGKIFVGGLCPETDRKKLQDYFEKYGEVSDSVVMIDANSKRSRGFGFVTFASPETVSIQEIQNETHILDGKKIDPKPATKKDKKYKLFVGGLNTHTDEKKLLDYFNKHSSFDVTVTNADIKRHPNNDMSKKFGFLTVDSEQSLQLILKHGEHREEQGSIFEIDGRKVEVKIANPQKQSQSEASNSESHMVYGQQMYPRYYDQGSHMTCSHVTGSGGGSYHHYQYPYIPPNYQSYSQPATQSPSYSNYDQYGRGYSGQHASYQQHYNQTGSSYGSGNNTPYYSSPGQYYNQPAGYNYTGEQTRGSPSSYTRGPPHSRGASQHHQYPSYGSR